ncbi:MAG: 23S rRNA (pseudouridine(1915)-N(3))-methyltransferase RlmH [Parcubacteria group bacterium]|nr:23S rRNA (pseudouridine(1915)-N(3))-methyltransferase RlmH [Parcubacteria group bacterium]
MLKITIIQVGKTKDEAVQSLVDEFGRRLQSSLNLQTVTVKTEDDLWNKVPERAYVIALEVNGKVYTSEQFAKFIGDKQTQGISHLVFLIGPAAGFTEYQKNVDLRLSLSAMTFSHQTVRLLLAEQLYRAMTILEGKPFAK